MRPDLILWATQLGIPTWLVPDYFELVSISTILGAALALHLARRDGADRKEEARSLALAYVGALLGGYLLEWLRAVPTALAAGSLDPMLTAGRAAYGGLLTSTAVVLLYRRRMGLPIAAFFDRVSVGTGLIFLFVRTGCFLAGCDYGIPTALRIGVRFPAHSLAARDHAMRGWIPHGAASLPVHPTQLYEAALGGIAAICALCILMSQRGKRDGRAFLTWLLVYGVGRFALEFLRGDATRGLYRGLSSAQYLSLVLILLAVALILTMGRRRHRDQDTDEESEPMRPLPVLGGPQ